MPETQPLLHVDHLMILRLKIVEELLICLENNNTKIIMMMILAVLPLAGSLP